MLFIHNQQLPLNNVLLCFFASRSIGEFLVSSFCQGQEIHESLDIRQQAWCHQKMLIEAFDLRSIQINWLSLARCRKSRNFRGRRLCRWCCGPCRRIIFDIRLNFTLLWRRSFYIDFIKFPVDCVNFLIDMDLDTTSEEENYLYFLKTHVKE